MNSEVGTFLRLLRGLPAEIALQMPVLSDIAVLSGAGGTIGAAGAIYSEAPRATPGLIMRRLDRRYARISVVYGELSRLDFKQAKPGTALEDLVFEQTDFDRYGKIGREDFNAFYDEGLDDFEDSFYKKNCMMDRAAVRKTIFHWYKPEGEYYSCAGTNPLLLGIMRTLHTALDFAPLIKPEEVLGESETLIRLLQSKSAIGEDALSGLTQNIGVLFSGLIESLNNVRITHADGMITTLFIREQGGQGAPVLCGTFHPSNKAHTIQLTR